ncbi:MAG: hypothetical protein Q8Q18_03035 [bacterium]|nr:hypothetical protein [bacterium]
MNQQKHRGVIALMFVLLFAGVSLASIGGGFGAVSDLAHRSRDIMSSKSSLLYADSIIDDVVYRVKTGKNISDGEIYVHGLLMAGISSKEEEGVTTYTVFGTSTDLARNVAVDVSTLSPPTFVDAVIVDGGGIVMSSNSRIIGDAYTNGSIAGYSNTEITGNASAVGTISSPQPSVVGVVTESASPVSIPIINEEYWRAQANINNDTYVGNLTLNGQQAMSIGPRKIEGNFTLNSNTDATVTGTLYITGDLTLNSNAKLVVSDSLALDGVVIVVDGTIHLNSNSPVIAAEGDPPGYPVLFSTKSSGTAVSVNSNASVEGMIYAPYADVIISSNASAVAVIANKLILNSNAEIDFDGAIAKRSYGGGTGGLLISNWKEVE